MTRISLVSRKKTLLYSIGIDPGTKNGAIAIVGDKLNIAYLGKAPYFSVDVKSKKVKPKLNKETGKYEVAYRQRTWTDFKKLREIFEPFLGNDIILTIEKVCARPGEREMSSFVFVNSLGIYEGQYSLLQPVEFFEPTPQTWKKDIGVTSDKSSSVELAQKIYNVNLRDYQKRGKLDDIAEALLLAFYGLRQYFNEDNN